ncbi:class I SAM-dependent methyltransferase, partial [Candidatus Woesearchaeota archaeon]|nr:class I SAM-dependent methyltransferase [Candidatus Woesearchaeota archaeon]
MPAELFKKIERLDRINWWILGKKELTSYLIRKFIPAGSSLLNVGCGSCNLGKEIFLHYTVLGVDDSKEMVGYCRSKGITAIKGSAGRLPFPDDSFDGVLCLDVLEHLKDDAAAEKE